jgi:hypothetical protein
LTQVARRSCGGTVGQRSLVQSVLKDLETSLLPEAEKALLRFVDKVNHDSPRIPAANLDTVRGAGWSDKPFTSPSRSVHSSIFTTGG